MSLKSAASAKQNREQKDLSGGNRAAPSRTLRNTHGAATFTGSTLNLATELREVEDVTLGIQGSTFTAATVTWAPGATAGTISLYAWDDSGVALAVPATVSWIAHGS